MTEIKKPWDNGKLKVRILTTGVYSFIGDIKGKNEIAVVPKKRPDGGNDWVLVIK